MARPFFTIGHSTRSIDEFVDLLSNAEVRLVVDVRTIPRSRANPQNSEALAKGLSESRIDYEHIAALGGLRGRKRDVPADVNAFWQNQRFHNYADYAMSEEFHSGLIRLRELGHATQCAIMCAEAVWWRCHRRIITDYLIAAGETVFHILGRKQLEPARMTGAAKIGPAGTLTYCEAQAATSAADRRDIPGDTELMSNLHEVVLGDAVAFGDLGNRREPVILERKVHQQE
jgi:uncharacterized protein (DUF488 family)